MVEVTFTGKCKGCPNFEPNIKKLYSAFSPIETVFTCEHEDLCNHLEQYLKETLSNE